MGIVEATHKTDIRLTDEASIAETLRSVLTKFNYMSVFNVGDLVRVDFGNGQYDEMGGVFVHDDMRVLNGQTFVVVQADSDFNRYSLRPSESSIAVTDARLRWSFIKEWLTLVETAEVVEDEQVTCYDGATYNMSQCVMLTEPSEFAGMYAHRGATNTLGVERPSRRVTLLLDEACNLLIDIEGNFFVRDDIDEDDYVMCDGGSSEGEYIWLDNAVCTENDGYFHENDRGCYFWFDERTSEYVTEEPEDDRPTLDYHTTKENGYVDMTNAETLYTIGFEVEKEDRHILERYSVSDLDESGWAREHDGSLDDEIGYELVSPIYDLFGDKLDNDMADTTLRRHINADSSYECGGHINFGKRGTSGAQLLKESAAFLPLFLALYRKRITGRWAKMKVDINKYDGSERYVAFHVQQDYIEFRLVSRVDGVGILLWRRDLFRIMANNGGKSVAQVQRMMLDRRSALHKHLRKEYTEERLLRLVCWYSQFADAMHDTLSVSQTGHGVMLDFFITSLKRNKKRISVGIDDVIGWAEEVSHIISRVDGGAKYAENVKPLSCEELKFLGK